MDESKDPRRGNVNTRKQNRSRPVSGTHEEATADPSPLSGHSLVRWGDLIPSSSSPAQTPTRHEDRIDPAQSSSSPSEQGRDFFRTAASSIAPTIPPPSGELVSCFSSQENKPILKRTYQPTSDMTIRPGHSTESTTLNTSINLSNMLDDAAESFTTPRPHGLSTEKSVSQSGISAEDPETPYATKSVRFNPVESVSFKTESETDAEFGGSEGNMSDDEGSVTDEDLKAEMEMYKKQFPEIFEKPLD